MHNTFIQYGWSFLYLELAYIHTIAYFAQCLDDFFQHEWNRDNGDCSNIWFGSDSRRKESMDGS